MAGDFDPLDFDSADFDAGETAGPAVVIGIVEPSDIVSVAGLRGELATISIIDRPDAVSATGLAGVIGALAVAEPPERTSAIGMAGIIGGGAIADPPDGVRAAGQPGIIGAMVVIEPVDTIKAFGEQKSGQLPTYAEHLLPDNSTALLKVLSASAKRITDIPAPIDLLHRPLDVPPQFLNHLAFEWSVDTWSRTWDETRKRAVTDAAIRLQRKKGTPYVLRQYVRYADAEVVKLERPPGKIFCGGSPTKEQRETWLRTLPQIRVWQFAEPVSPPSCKAFVGSSSPDRRPLPASMLNAGFFYLSSTAAANTGHRARWVVNDVEQDDVGIVVTGTTYELHPRSAAGASVYGGTICNNGRYFVPSKAALGIITVTPGFHLPHRSPVGPTLQALSAEPERVSLQSVPGCSVFDGTPCNAGRFYSPTKAAMRVYERFPVLAPGALRVAPVYFNNTGRYGMPPHTAYATIRQARPRCDYQAGEGIPEWPRQKFWLQHDNGPLGRMCDAVVAAKRLSDIVLVDTNTGPKTLADGRPILADIDKVLAY